MRAHGINVCLRLGLICRTTREEAISVAKSILPEDRQERTTSLKDDSQMYREGAAVARDAHWLSRNLWAGLVPHYGPVWTVLLGSAEQVADTFLAYKKIGVTDFIISGWPEIDEVIRFGREVLPLVRESEKPKRLNYTK
jgi:alkanesulfonate monooxygenase